MLPNLRKLMVGPLVPPKETYTLMSLRLGHKVKEITIEAPLLFKSAISPIPTLCPSLKSFPLCIMISGVSDIIY